MTSSGIGPAAGWALKHPQPLCIDTCCCIFACLYDDIVWYCMHLLSLIYLLSIHLTFPIAELMYLKLRGTLYIYIFMYICIYVCIYIHVYVYVPLIRGIRSAGDPSHRMWPAAVDPGFVEFHHRRGRLGAGGEVQDVQAGPWWWYWLVFLESKSR